MEIVPIVIAVVLLVLLISVYFMFFSSSQVSAEWLNSNWHYRQKLTINNSAQSTDLNNFPVMVKITSSNTSFWNHVQSSCADVRFTNISGALLGHEIEKCDSGNYIMIVWVKVFKINASSNENTIYMYYGNPSAADGQNAGRTWNSNYKMVQHFTETSGNHYDSTLNNNASTSMLVSTQGSATGQISGADYLDGEYDYINFGTISALDFGSSDDFTLEVWVNPDNASTGAVISNEDTNEQGYNLIFTQNRNVSFNLDGIVTSGLALHLNEDDLTSYPGQPTTNLGATEYTPWPDLGWAGGGGRWEITGTYPDGLPFTPAYVLREQSTNNYWGSFWEGNGFIPTGTLPYQKYYTLSFWYYLESSYDGSSPRFLFYGRPNSGDSAYTNITTQTGNTFSTGRKGAWRYGTHTRQITTDAYSYHYTSGFNPGTIIDGKRVYIAQWQFEEGQHATPYVAGIRSITDAWKDLSVNSNHADLDNVSFTSSAKIDFDGTDDYVEIPDSATVRLTTKTVEMWVKMNGTYTSANLVPFVVYANLGSSTNRMWLGMQNNYFRMHGWGTSDPYVTTNINDGNYHHLVWNYDTTNQKMNMWVDGVQGVTNFNQTEGGIVGDSNNEWYLGRFHDYYSSFDIEALDGEIPVFRLYNTLLSDADVKRNFKTQAYKHGVANDATTTDTLTLDTFSHIVATKQGTTCSIYINGSLSKSFTCNVSQNLVGSLRIGGRTSSDMDEFFNGVIDEVRISNTARSADWIAATYLSETDNFINVSSEEKGPGPIAYWRFNEGYGTVTSDRTSNNNDGTIIGATWQTEDMCISGKCLKLSNDNYMNVPALILDLSEDHSISTWFKVNQWDSYASGAGLTSGPNNRGWDDVITIYANAINLQDDTGAGKSVSVSVNLNTWYYLTLNIKTSGIEVYLNGVYKGGTSAFSPANTLTIDRIGRGYGHDTLIGFIDEFKIYPYARTSSQIKTDYLGGKVGLDRGAAGVMGVKKFQGDINLSDGLIGYWDMDESSWTNDCTATSVTDSSGNGNNGKACPASTGPTGGATGKFGRGGSFDGTEDYVNWGDILDVGTSDWSISAWVKASVQQDSWQGTVVSKRSSDPDRDHMYELALRGISDATNVDKFMFSFGKGTGNSSINIYSNQTYLDGKWHLVTGVADRDGYARLYVDGVLHSSVDISAYASQNLNNTAALQVGQEANGNYEFEGQIDDVRIYNRALSTREVRLLYEWAPGPVGYWKMDEKTGDYAYDTSSNDNSGQLGGGTANYKPTWARGKYGGALDFDGSNDYINITDVSDFSNVPAITISAWVNFDDFDNNYPNIVTTDPNNLAFHGLGPAYGANQGKVGFYHNGATRGGGWCDVYTPILSTGTWYYVTVVNDGSNNYMYLDGVLVDSDACGVTENIGSITSLWIGAKNDGQAQNATDGKIDDLRIYNYARSPKQIIEDMNAGHPGQTRPIAYWKLDEGYGDTAYDSGLSARNGDLQGSCPGAATCPTWTNAGKFGKALSFDGGDYLANNEGGFLPTGDDPRTITFWFKPNGGMGVSQSAVSYGCIGGTEVQGCGSAGKGRYVGIWANTNNIGIALETCNSYGPSTPSPTTSWHFYTAVFNGNNTITYYIDGKNPIISTPNCTINTSNGNGMIIGASRWGYYNGTIDEVKVYNFALTSEEISVEYNRGQVAVMGATRTSTSTWDDGGFGGNPPIAEWKFDEKTGASAYDTSENENIGTITGATWQGSGYCKYGSCLSFDGTAGPNINIGTPSSLTAISNGDFTISAWVKTSDTGSRGAIIGSCCSFPAVNFEINAAGNGAMRYWHNGNGSTDSWFGNKTGLNDGIWHHVVMVRDKTNNKGRIYVDGVLDRENAIIAPNGAIASNIRIGTDNRLSADITHNGSIDHIKIYDYARTTAQIAYDYNKGKPIVHLRFDEGQGGTAYDDSNNNNDGIINIVSGGTQTKLGSVKVIDTAAAWYNGRNGKQGYSINLDGGDDYVNLGNSTLIRFDDRDFSISLWFYADASQESGSTHLFDKGHLWGYRMQWETTGKVEFSLADNGSVQRRCWSDEQGSTLTSGQWYFTTLTYDYSASTLYGYINGVQVCTEPVTGTPGMGNYNLSIGSYAVDTTLENFKGQIDDFRIYNYTLTVDQIKQVYNFGAARLGTGN